MCVSRPNDRPRPRPSTSRSTGCGRISEAQGWPLPEGNIFRDDGYSGASLKRPGLDRLRDRAAMASFDTIFITDPDRLARNYVHQVLLLEELQKHGCRVEFLDRPMSQDPHDQLLLQIRGAVAEYERTLIAERMRRGRQRQFQAGKMLPWTRAPYGYRMAADRPRDPSGVYQDPAEAAVVAEIFAWYLEGRHTLHGLVDHLHELGVPSPSGKPYWSGPSVRGILRNPVYTGRVYAGRTRYRDAQVRRSATHPIGRPHGTATPVPEGEWIEVGAVPAVVTREQFDRVQAKLAANQSFSARNNKVGDISPEVAGQLRGVRAGVPGAAAPAAEQLLRLHGQDPSGPAPQRGDLRLAGTSHPGPSMTWSGRTSVDLLRHPEAVAEAFRRRVGRRLAPAGIPGAAGSPAAGEGVAGPAARAADRGLPRRRHPAAGVPSVAAPRSRPATRPSAEQESSGSPARPTGSTRCSGSRPRWKSFCERVSTGLEDATFDRRRQLVELLIDRVIVTGDEVEIRYVFPTSPQSEHVRFCHLRSDYLHHPADLAQPAAVRRPPLGDVRLDPQPAQQRPQSARCRSPGRRTASSGSSLGRPGVPPTLGKSRTTGRICVWSLALAPAVRITSGTPALLTIRVCFVPGLRRSTGLGPVASPPPKGSRPKTALPCGSGSRSRC